MADLATLVKARFSNARLRDLTRPDSEGYTTPDDDFLDGLIDDVVGMFDVHGVSTSIDTDNKAHVDVAVELVVAKAQLRIRWTDDNRARLEMWTEELRALAKISRHRRRNPVSSSASVPAVRRMPRASARDTIPGKPRG